MLYKPGMRHKNNTLLWLAALYFSYLFYGDDIANTIWSLYNVFHSNFFLPFETEIN